MSYIKDSLSKNEVIKKQFSIHWYWTILPAILYILLIPFTFFVTLLILPFHIIKYMTIEQGVTNKRVIKKTGFLSRNTEEMKISAIETVEIKQSIMGRIFSFGDVKITGRGNSSVVLERIFNPMSAKRIIESADE